MTAESIDTVLSVIVAVTGNAVFARDWEF